MPQKSSSDDKQEDYKGFHEAMRARTSKFSLGPSSRAVSLQQQIAWLENEYTRHVQSENKEYTMIFAEVRGLLLQAHKGSPLSCFDNPCCFYASDKERGQ